VQRQTPPPSSLSPRQELAKPVQPIQPVQPIKPVQQKQPFKEAFQKVSSAESPAPIPLSSLSRNNQSAAKNPAVANKQKVPTPQNVNDLKSALASIIGGKNPENKKETKEKESPKESPKEVPKDVLEDVLKVG
jgi:hypothetical protein